MSVIYSLKRVFALIIAALMFIGVGSNHADPHTVLDAEECRLCVTVLSDVHIEGNNLPRYNVFGRILKDVKNNEFGNDAVVFLGDNTMNGQDIESMLFYGAVAKVAPSDNCITVVGNHDVGNGEGDYNKLLDRYLGFNNAFLDAGIKKPYNYRVINGCYFITLAPEELCVSEMPISDEQLAFLDETLDTAEAEGAISFVCAHHPWYYADDTENYSLGEILASHKNVFYLSGHTHMPIIDGWTFDFYEGVREINLPRCTELTGEKDHDVYSGTGDGIQLEVYEDEVICRVRNYYTGTWDEEMVYHFALDK